MLGVFKKNFQIQNAEDTFKYVLQEINSYVDMIEESRANLDEKVKQRTTELEKAYRKLQSTQEQLIQSEKLAAMGQLVSAMVHEINNPLGGMLNCVRELLNGIDDEEQEEEYLNLLQNVKKVKHISP